eukprot:1143989-Pelagomonas_calceolata.AAC.1
MPGMFMMLFASILGTTGHVCIAMLQKSNPTAAGYVHMLFGPIVLLRSMIPVILMTYKMKNMCCSGVPNPRCITWLEHSANGCLETPDTLLETVRPQWGGFGIRSELKYNEMNDPVLRRDLSRKKERKKDRLRLPSPAACIKE